MILHHCRFPPSLVIPLVTNVGSSRDEPDTPSVPDVLPDTLLRDRHHPMCHVPMPESPPEVVSDLPDYLTSCVVRRPPSPVPRWRLAREGPFLSEQSSSSLRCFGMAVLSGIRRIAHRITPRRLENLGLRCIILGS